MTALRVTALLALLCAQASTLPDPTTPEDDVVDQVDNDVSLLQAASLQAPSRPAQPRPEVDSDVSLLQAAFQLRRGPPGHDSRYRDAPRLVVDLDLAPELRWRNVTRHYVGLGVFPAFLELPITDPALRRLAETMEVEEEYRREMEGIAADLGLSESAVYNLVLMNIGSEISGNRDGPRGTLDEHNGTMIGCSGLLAATPNGTVVHGRNMDYVGFRMEANGRTLLWPDVTVEVVFVREGRPLFTAVQFPGVIGIHTAMRFGGWSFEEQTRFHFMDSSILYGLFRGSQGFMLLARRIMETTQDFEAAVQKLGALNLMAPGYFILAGPRAYEGAVVTMDRGGEHAPETQRVTRLGSGKAFTNWHIIQTNDDLNRVALDERRPVEELRLANATQDIVSADWALGEMTTSPIYNKDTVFSTVYVPATGYHRTIVHYGHFR